MREQHSCIHVENILPQLPATFTTMDVVRALDLTYHESVYAVSQNLRALELRGKIREVGRGDRNKVIWARNTVDAGETRGEVGSE